MTTSHTAGNYLGGGIAGALGIGGIHHVDPPHGGFGHDLGSHGIEHHAGKGFGLPADPMHFIFPDPVPAGSPHNLFTLQAVPLPGGLTMSLVALVAISCLVIVLASTLVKTVVVRCSN